MTVKIFVGDCRDVLRSMAPASVHCVVTSPPYWGLRNYGVPPTVWGGASDCSHEWGGNLKHSGGNGQQGESGQRAERSSIEAQEKQRDAGAFCCRCGAWRGTFGLEPTYQLYVEHSVEIFREVHRVLRPDGTLWLNLGDSYATAAGKVGDHPGGGVQGANFARINMAGKQRGIVGMTQQNRMPQTGLKPKDLCGIPWRVALALQADGWWLRQDIVWCLSGGAWLYVKTATTEGPMMLKDVARLDPATVRLWNGQRWTQLLGTSRSKRRGNELELVLRSGERITCTPTHKFPTARGLLAASDLAVGDVIETARLPQPGSPRDCSLDTDAAWFAGLYLAEGSRSDDCIQIAGHTKETERWERLVNIAKKYGGSATRTVAGNKMDVRLHGRVLNAIIDEFVSGRIAKDKGFKWNVWAYSDEFVAAMLDGYLAGDGSWDAANSRWRIGFCRNYNLERDLRTACARLGYTLTLKPTVARLGDKLFPSFRGEIRTTKSFRNMGEIVEIRKARCREVYDVGVADDPHLFALASGVLTHNSKPNPMPESVTDRCTKSHEYLFMLTKSERYFFDQDAILEQATSAEEIKWSDNQGGIHSGEGHIGERTKVFRVRGSGNTQRKTAQERGCPAGGGKNQCGSVPWEDVKRNKRSVWTVTTILFKEAHFATFPPALIEPCVKAGASEKGCCAKCGAPQLRQQERTGPDGTVVTVLASARFAKRSDGAPLMGDNAFTPDEMERGSFSAKSGVVQKSDAGWAASCICGAEIVPCVVLDPFGGAGTTGIVADRLQRDAVLIELNPEYAAMADRRIRDEAGMFTKVTVETVAKEAAE